MTVSRLNTKFEFEIAALAACVYWPMGKPLPVLLQWVSKELPRPFALVSSMAWVERPRPRFYPARRLAEEAP